MTEPIKPETLANPANPPAKTTGRRIPMALPTLKLAVPEIPGYHTHWFRGTGQRIQQALNAGYVFVERDELVLNGFGLATSYDVDGNTDLGTRVSIPSGGEEAAGQAGRLYLMKIKNELWQEDEELVFERHEQIAAQLRGDKGFTEAGMDASQRYTRGENRNMFTPRRS